MKQTLIWFNLQRHGTRNGLSNVNLHQSLRILKAGLSSSYRDGWAKYKEKVPNVSDLNQNVETTYWHTIPNSIFHNLKINSSKGCRKTSHRWIIYDVATYLTQQFYKYWNFQLKISLQIMGFCFDWWILLLLTLTSIT